jgi:hypothetical protein
MREEIVRFFQRQNFVIVSTIDSKNSPHNSCKGIVTIDQKNKIYLFDLYRGRTFNHLQHNSHISITAVDEHHFKGYCLKGKAKIIKPEKFPLYIIRAWEKRIAARIAHRLLKNIRGEKGHPRHPEAQLPQPEYLIAMQVKQVIDLTPRHLRRRLDNK